MILTFLDRLPADHPIRRETVTQARRIWRDMEMEVELPTQLNDCREWRAARLWLWDDEVTVDEDTLKRLSPAERTTLCKVLGIPATGRVKAVCDRIVEKVARARLSSYFVDNLQTTDNASFCKIADMNRAALLAALGEIPGGRGADPRAPLCQLRESLAAGRWLFFHCRQGSDFDGLPESARMTVENLLGIPRGWRQDARHGALEGFVRDWRVDATSRCSAIWNSSADITAGVEAMDLDPPGGQGGGSRRAGRDLASLGPGAPDCTGGGPGRPSMDAGGGSGGGGARGFGGGVFDCTGEGGAGSGLGTGVPSLGMSSLYCTGGGNAGPAYSTGGQFHSPGGGWAAPPYCSGAGPLSAFAQTSGGVGSGSGAGSGNGFGGAFGGNSCGFGGLDLTNPLLPASLAVRVWGNDPCVSMFQWGSTANASPSAPVAKKSHPDSNILGPSYCGDGVNPGSSIFDRHKGAGAESLLEAARMSVPANSPSHIKLFHILEPLMRMTVVPAQVQNERQNAVLNDMRKSEGTDHVVTPWIATRPWLQGFYLDCLDPVQW